MNSIQFNGAPSPAFAKLTKGKLASASHLLQSKPHPAIRTTPENDAFSTAGKRVWDNFNGQT